MSAVPAANDTDDLQQLFDSIVVAKTGPGAPADAAQQAVQPAPAQTSASPALLTRIGQLTRTLHDSLRELGYDEALEDTAAAIPDARDRLAYVATLTERAAQRVLAATEIAIPLQRKIEQSASQLSSQWQRAFDAQMGADDFKALAQSTLAFLSELPTHTKATCEQLHEIMMAQDFQDLTGQVIKRINDLVHRFEHELLRVLVEQSPQQRRATAADSLLNGPVISAAGRDDVFTTQSQVDELLASLGF